MTAAMTSSTAADVSSVSASYSFSCAGSMSGIVSCPSQTVGKRLHPLASISSMHWEDRANSCHSLAALGWGASAKMAVVCTRPGTWADSSGVRRRMALLPLSRWAARPVLSQPTPMTHSPVDRHLAAVSVPVV